jgi:hypothetical protein
MGVSDRRASHGAVAGRLPGKVIAISGTGGGNGTRTGSAPAWPRSRRSVLSIQTSIELAVS